jgi:hypothetical protein
LTLAAIIKPVYGMSVIKRVFFHELGHFVARELNAKYYNRAPIKSIEIYLCNAAINEYCGELVIDKTNHPEDGDVPTIKNLAPYLASSTYGCIFQSLYLGQSLSDCFNKNGQDDYGKWMEALTVNKLENCKAAFVATEKEYFESLSGNPTIVEILKIDPFEFAKKPSQEAANYYVEIDNVRNKISTLIDKHYTTYQQLISRYQKLFNGC